MFGKGKIDSPFVERNIPIDEESPDKNPLEKKLKKYKVTSIVLSLLLCCAIVFIAFIVFREKESEEAFFSKVYEKKTYRLCDNPERLLEEIETPGYVAGTTIINGYEYFSFTTNVNNEEVQLCFQNEFPDEEKKDSTVKSLIRKNDSMVNLSKDYDINNLSEELPLITKLTDGKEALLFMEVEDGMPGNMSLYAVGEDIYKISAINMTSTIRYYFDVECDNGYVKVTHNGVTYTYETKDEVLAFADEKSSNMLKVSDEFVYEQTEDGMYFTAHISLDEKAYIGDYICKIAYTSAGFDMASQKFEAYVYPEYEDPGDKRILTPRDTYLTEKISIVGKNGGYYALELYENVPVSKYDYEQIIQNENGIKEYIEADGRAVSQFGVDVSKFQGEIDWEALKEQGATFVIPRIAYRGYSAGAIVEDESFETNVEGAKAAGLDVGIYFFSQAVTVEEGVEEAEFIIEKIKDLDINGPIVFDTEYYDEPADARANLITREERTAIARAFCETIENAGYKPMIYANTRWLLLGINWDELAEYDVWYAYYGDEPVIPYEFAMWQYSCEGLLEGIDNYVDMNIMLKDVFE